MRSWLALCPILLTAAEFPAIRLHRVLSGFDLPVDIASPRDGSGRLFIVQQRGLVRLVKNGAIAQQPVLDFRTKVSCCGERGLLGLAFPPGTGSKRHFYVNYTNTQGNTVVSRIHLTADDDIADPASEEIILTVAQPFENHNGGGLAFGPRDGYLYIGLGDGGSGGDPQNNGQRRDVLLGKMLRIDVESGVKPYAIPPTNPFGDLIWATGLRNPWRYSFDRENGDLYIADVGQNRAEEVHVQSGASAGGENYGWRLMEGLQCYPPTQSCNREGLTLPVVEYGRSQGASITGGFVYRGSRYPALRGTYLYADYVSGNIWGLQREGAGWANQLLLTGPRNAISSFGEDESGEIHATGHTQGELYLVTAGPPTFSSTAVVNAASFGPGLVPGSIATLFGTGLTALGGIVNAASLPLPVSLNGTSLTFNGIEASLFAVANVNGQEQINFQVPAQVAGATSATVIVTANGQQSPPVRVSLAAAQPELFAVPEATRGSIISIYGTGFGNATNIDLRIGGVPAQVSYAGPAPTFVGLYQINAAIPDTVPAGTVDVTVSIGTATSRPIKLTIR